MKRDLTLTGFASGVVVGIAVAMLAVGVFATGIFHTQEAAAQAAPAAQGQAVPAQGCAAGGGRGQRGPATPPAPCGPNIEGDLGANTAKDSRCFELRMYTVD